MSDEQQQGGAQDAQPTSQPPQPGNVADLPEWAQKALREAREEAADRRIALKKMTEAQQQRLIDEGNFKALAEQRAAELAALTPIKERAETLEKMIRESNSSRINTVREDMRALIPDSLSPENLSKWLDVALPKLTTPAAPNIDAGAGAGNGGSRTASLTDEEKRIAKRSGMTLEEFAAAKAKLNSQQ